MDINKYPYSHRGTVEEPTDSATLQAEQDNVNILTQLTKNFNYLKAAADIYGKDKLTEIDTINNHNLTDLAYKYGYVNINNVAITWVNPEPSISLNPGEIIYSLGSGTYIKFAQPHQSTYLPVIDKNGNITFKFLQSDYRPRIIRGPLTNGCWQYRKTFGLIYSDGYLNIPIGDIFAAGTTITLLPWDLYDINFLDPLTGEKIAISFQEETYNSLTNEYYNDSNGHYFIRLKILSPLSTYVNSLIVEVY